MSVAANSGDARPLKIVLLARPGLSTNILFHAIERECGVSAVIFEEAVARREFLARRARRLGYLPVAGQILFQVLVPPLLRRIARKRIRDIICDNDFDTAPVPESRAVRVKSANSADARSALAGLNPDLVVINGTRILDAATLNAVPARFINIHAGITPMYRGVHGGYWALAASDAGNCGVTVHEVDTGVDTGRILEQARIAVTQRDNFVTYPLLQLGAGIPCLLRQLTGVPAGGRGVEPTASPLPSRLWSHPTLWGYLATVVRTGVY